MEGRYNPAYNPEGEIPAKDIELSEQFSQPSNGPNGPASNPDSAPHQKVNINEDETVKHTEDYSLLSFIPKYRSLKQKYSEQFQTKGRYLKIVLGLIPALLYIVFIIAAVATSKDEEKTNGDYWCDGTGLLIVITAFAAAGLIYYKILLRYFAKSLNATSQILQKATSKLFKKRISRICLYLGLLLFLVIFLYIDTADDRKRLKSVVGTVSLLLFGFLFSYAPRKINWRQVIWGFSVQFLLGLAILRSDTGKAVFQCFGGKVARFLAFTDKGSSFVFGYLAEPDSLYGLKVLTVILFFSFLVHILYFYGVMQWVVMKLGWILQVTIGTTPCESVNAAANIFLGQTETPLMIKPYIPLMTKSELHAIMTGGFATIAGGVLAAFISFGIDASHLLSASVMNAPAALAFSKLFYPEIKKSNTSVGELKIIGGEGVNALHSAVLGITAALPLVANIAANLVAFIACIAFFNAVFDWTCQQVGVDSGVCTLENISGYVFMPLAWTMGVPWNECRAVGELIGLKTIVNEFYAYLQLAKKIQLKQLSKRAQIISTYALCGFSNISSIGIQVGGMGALVPERREDMAKVALRAMIAGSAASFLTACIAGLLVSDE